MKKKILFGFIMLFLLAYRVHAQIMIDDVTVYVPNAPTPGMNVNYDYSVPNNAGYTVVTWNNGKMFVNGFIYDNKYVEGEDYEWITVVCPKEGYAFPEGANNVTFHVDGIDVNDSSLVKNTYNSINGTTCRGINIDFQTLPGTTYKFVSTPSLSSNAYINEKVDLSFKFSTDAEIKLQWKNNNDWDDIETIDAVGNEVTTFSVPTETETINKYYRLNYDDKKFAEFRIIWVDPNKIIDSVDITLPSRPLVGRNIDTNYSVPSGRHYTKADYLNNQILVNFEGIEVNGKYEEGKSYTWIAVVCPTDGYSFPENPFMVNYTVNGIDLNDDEYVYSYYKNIYATTCSGLQITFKPLVYVPTYTPTLNMTVNNNSVALEWEEQLYASKYILYRSNDNKKWTAYKTLTTNRFVDNSLTYNKTYYYKVRACEPDKCSGYSNLVYKKILPNKTNLVIKSASTTNVRLHWDRVNTNGYEIYRSLNKKNWTKIATINKNTTLDYNNTKLKGYTGYYYRVRAYKVVGSSKVYGPWSNMVATFTAPVKPTLKLTVRDYNAINVIIGATKGATKYIVEKSLDNKTYERIEELPKEGTLASSDLTTGKVYYYRVSACNYQNRCSPWVVSYLRSTTKAPGISVYSPKTKVITTTLGSVNMADGYEVYRSGSKNGTYHLIRTLPSDGPFLFNSVGTKGRTYYYKARTYIVVNGTKVYSPWSAIKTVKSK